jgi:predicted HTH transcriptional regulator
VKYQCEFKENFYSEKLPGNDAFTNTKGGYILFGVDDDKKIVGVESETSELVKDTSNGCEPKIDYTIIIKKLMEKK